MNQSKDKEQLTPNEYTLCPSQQVDRDRSKEMYFLQRQKEVNRSCMKEIPIILIKELSLQSHIHVTNQQM